VTAGIESGRGVVSMRVDWLKLQILVSKIFGVDYEITGTTKGRPKA